MQLVFVWIRIILGMFHSHVCCFDQMTSCVYMWKDQWIGVVSDFNYEWITSDYFNLISVSMIFFVCIHNQPLQMYVMHTCKQFITWYMCTRFLGKYAVFPYKYLNKFPSCSFACTCTLYPFDSSIYCECVIHYTPTINTC